MFNPPATGFYTHSVSVLGGEDDLVTVYSFHERRVVVRGQGHKSWVSVVSMAAIGTPTLLTMIHFNINSKK